MGSREYGFEIFFSRLPPFVWCVYLARWMASKPHMYSSQAYMYVTTQKKLSATRTPLEFNLLAKLFFVILSPC